MTSQPLRVDSSAAQGLTLGMWNQLKTCVGRSTLLSTSELLALSTAIRMFMIRTGNMMPQSTMKKPRTSCFSNIYGIWSERNPHFNTFHTSHHHFTITWGEHHRGILGELWVLVGPHGFTLIISCLTKVIRDKQSMTMVTISRNHSRASCQVPSHRNTGQMQRVQVQYL